MKKVVFVIACTIWAISCMAQTIIIAPKYTQARGFSERLAAVKQDGKWGFINVKGEMVIPAIYAEVRDFHEGKAAVKTEKGWGYIDSKNKMVISDKFFDARDFSEGLASVKPTIDTEAFNRDGYEGEDWGHYNELASWQYIKEDGTLAFKGSFRDVSTFHDGVACVYHDTSWEFINKKGNTVLKTKYDNNYPVHYSNGLIPNIGGELGDEWGYCDLSGNWVIMPQYRTVTEFCDGIAVVEEFGGKMKVIDNTGKELYSGVDETLVLFKGGYILDGHSLYHLGSSFEIYTTTNISSTYWPGFWPVTGIVTIPSAPPASYGASVSVEGPMNIQSIKIARQLKAISYEQPGEGLWVTCFDNGYSGFSALNIQDYIRQQVLLQMSEWQKKDEFESMSEWQQRTSEEQKHKIMAIIASQLINQLQDKEAWKLSNYDADHETFALNTYVGQYVIKVPRTQAKSFKNEWDNTRKEVEFGYKDGLFVESMAFYPPNGNSFRQVIDNSLVYDGRDVSIDMSGNSLVINMPENKIDEGRGKVKGNVSPSKKSDVDIDIPTTKTINSNTFAIIIGNEQYEEVAHVDYALNDARIFADYCKKTLGLPEQNIKLYENASYGKMIGAVHDMQKIANAYKGNVSFIFYYAGHGIPDVATNESYLLPVDANGMNMEVCYPLTRLYQEFGELQAKNVIVFLDACFSGTQRGNDMIVAVRNIVVRVKPNNPSGKTIVFSAASEKQTAFPYSEKGHGLFTYYLLKRLRETAGECTLKELGTYICEEVEKQSVVTNGKEQTPVVLTSPELGNEWQKLRLK